MRFMVKTSFKTKESYNFKIALTKFEELIIVVIVSVQVSETCIIVLT